jgi:hypothetical protein
LTLGIIDIIFRILFNEKKESNEQRRIEREGKTELF